MAYKTLYSNKGVKKRNRIITLLSCVLSRRFCLVAKNTYCLRHVRPSVRLFASSFVHSSACISGPPTTQTSKKSYIGNFY